MTEAYLVDEPCPDCGVEVAVLTNGTSNCPECGHPEVLPCSIWLRSKPVVVKSVIMLPLNKRIYKAKTPKRLTGLETKVLNTKPTAATKETCINIITNRIPNTYSWNSSLKTISTCSYH